MVSKPKKSKSNFLDNLYSEMYLIHHFINLDYKNNEIHFKRGELSHIITLNKQKISIDLDVIVPYAGHYTTKKTFFERNQLLYDLEHYILGKELSVYNLDFYQERLNKKGMDFRKIKKTFGKPKLKTHKINNKLEKIVLEFNISPKSRLTKEHAKQFIEYSIIPIHWLQTPEFKREIQIKKSQSQKTSFLSSNSASS